MSNYETISVSDNPNGGTDGRLKEGRKESEIDRLRFPQTIPASSDAAPRDIEQSRHVFSLGVQLQPTLVLVKLKALLAPFLCHM